MISKTAARCLDESADSSFMRWFEAKMEELEKTNFVVVVKAKPSQSIGLSKCYGKTPRPLSVLEQKIEAAIARWPELSPWQLSKKMDADVWPNTIKRYMMRRGQA